MNFHIAEGNIPHPTPQKTHNTFKLTHTWSTEWLMLFHTAEGEIHRRRQDYFCFRLSHTWSIERTAQTFPRQDISPQSSCASCFTHTKRRTTVVYPCHQCRGQDFSRSSSSRRAHAWNTEVPTPFQVLDELNIKWVLLFCCVFLSFFNWKVQTDPSRTVLLMDFCPCEENVYPDGHGFVFNWRVQTDPSWIVLLIDFRPCKGNVYRDGHVFLFCFKLKGPNGPILNSTADSLPPPWRKAECLSRWSCAVDMKGPNGPITNSTADSLPPPWRERLSRWSWSRGWGPPGSRCVRKSSCRRSAWGWGSWRCAGDPRIPPPWPGNTPCPSACSPSCPRSTSPVNR